MQEAEERILPKWPLRLTLSLLIVVEIFFVVMFVGAGSVEHLLNIVNSAGLLVCGVLTWLAIPWSRWLAVAFLLWKIVGIGVSLSAHFGDHRTDGSLMLIGFYIVIGIVLASPLGSVRLRAAT